MLRKEDKKRRYEEEEEDDRPKKRRPRDEEDDDDQPKPSKKSAGKGSKSGLDVRSVMAAADDLGGSDFYDLKPGTHYVRFMQNPQDNTFFVSVQEMYIPRAEKGEKKRRFVSPRSLGRDQFCPAQAVYEALVRSGSDANKKLASEIRPVHRFVSNAVVKDPKTGSWVATQVRYAPKVFKALCEHLIAGNEDEIKDLDEGDLLAGDIITDPEVGVVFKITRTGTGKNDTDYSVSPTSKTLPLKDEWLAARKDMSTMAVPSDVDAITEALCEFLDVESISEILSPSGSSSAAAAKRSKPRADEDDDDEEDRPAKRRPARREDDDDEEDEPPAKKRRPSKDDDDDEDDEPPAKKRRTYEDDDDEEEDRPAKKKARPSKDDDDEEDEEDDEPPARSKKRAARDDDEEDDDDDDDPRGGRRREPMAVSRLKGNKRR